MLIAGFHIDPLGLAGGIITFTAACGAVLAVTRWMNARWHRVAEFLEDWNGEPARPGIKERRPGIMERLAAVEASVRTIRIEVTPDHGGSMKDTMGRIDTQTRRTGESIQRHLDWHANRGEIDPTARVLLYRADERE